jgi:DNA-binding IclR family transcriptional regulator
MKDLANTRARGYSTDLEELEQGIHAVGAPIFDKNRMPVASIAIAGPAFRLSRKLMENIGLELIEAAKEISKELIISKTMDVHH